MHCKIKQKLSLNIFITIISIIHTKHVADLLKNLRTCIFLDKFSNSLLATLHHIIQSLSSCLSNTLLSGALLDGVVDEDLDVAVEHLLLVCVLLLSQGGAVAVQRGEVLLAAPDQGGFHGGLVG